MERATAWAPVAIARPARPVHLLCRKHVAGHRHCQRRAHCARGGVQKGHRVRQCHAAGHATATPLTPGAAPWSHARASTSATTAACRRAPTTAAPTLASGRTAADAPSRARDAAAAYAGADDDAPGRQGDDAWPWRAATTPASRRAAPSDAAATWLATHVSFASLRDASGRRGPTTTCDASAAPHAAGAAVSWTLSWTSSAHAATHLAPTATGTGTSAHASPGGPSTDVARRSRAHGRCRKGTAPDGDAHDAWAARIAKVRGADDGGGIPALGDLRAAG